MNSTDTKSCIYLPVGHITPTFVDTNVFYYTSKVAMTINLVSLPVCVIGNALVLLAIVRTPSLYTPANILIASLALADFLVGAVVQPFITFIIIDKDALFHCKYVDACII